MRGKSNLLMKGSNVMKVVVLGAVVVLAAWTATSTIPLLHGNSDSTSTAQLLRPELLHKCSDTCAWARNGKCDEGRPGSSSQEKEPSRLMEVQLLCDLGTDCTDCGPYNGPDYSSSWHSDQKLPPVSFSQNDNIKMWAASTQTEPSFIFPYTEWDKDTDVSFQMHMVGVVEGGISQLFQEILSKRCKREDGTRALVLDVGSNFGYFAVFSAMMGCRVIAWEPVPRFRAFLEWALAVNNVAHLVIIRPKVVSALPPGTIFNLSIPKIGSWGTASVDGQNSYFSNDNDWVQTESERIDDVVDEAVLLMKADVEGYERYALASAKKLLGWPLNMEADDAYVQGSSSSSGGWGSSGSSSSSSGSSNGGSNGSSSGGGSSSSGGSSSGGSGSSGSSSSGGSGSRSSKGSSSGGSSKGSSGSSGSSGSTSSRSNGRRRRALVDNVVMEFSPLVPEMEAKKKEQRANLALLHRFLHAGYNIANLPDYWSKDGNSYGSVVPPLRSVTEDVLRYDEEDINRQGSWNFSAAIQEELGVYREWAHFFKAPLVTALWNNPKSFRSSFYINTNLWIQSKQFVEKEHQRLQEQQQHQQQQRQQQKEQQLQQQEGGVGEGPKGFLPGVQRLGPSSSAMPLDADAAATWLAPTVEGFGKCGFRCDLDLKDHTRVFWLCPCVNMTVCGAEEDAVKRLLKEGAFHGFRYNLPPVPAL